MDGGMFCRFKYFNILDGFSCMIAMLSAVSVVYFK